MISRLTQMASYNRYKAFTGDDGTIRNVPFVSIPVSSSDKYMFWKAGRSRLDLISYSYYGDCDYRWLILQANPEIPSIELLIEDETRIRIPYPLDDAISRYENAVQMHDHLYGVD